MIICGIDPGAKGAIAWYWPATPAVVQVDGLPYTGNGLDGGLLATWLRTMGPDRVFLERVEARAGQSVQSCATSHRNFGIIEGVLAALAIPYALTSAAKWKRDMRLSADKDLSRALALRTWPDAASLRGPNGRIVEGRAEAALLALWGSRQ